MNKSQAIHNFWSGFGLPAYDETTVPDDAKTPYITYNVTTDSIDNTLMMHASLWYRTSSWKDISDKAEEIAEAITKMDPPSIKIDNGRLYIAKGSPFAQRMTDEDRTIRRMYINIQTEFLANY